MRTYTPAMNARTLRLLSYASPSPLPSPLPHILRSSLQLAVLWGSRGQLAARCFEGSAGLPFSAVVVAVQREPYLKCGVIRDFCSYRVRWEPVAGTRNTHVGLRSTTLA